MTTRLRHIPESEIATLSAEALEEMSDTTLHAELAYVQSMLRAARAMHDAGAVGRYEQAQLDLADEIRMRALAPIVAMPQSPDAFLFAGLSLLAMPRV